MITLKEYFNKCSKKDVYDFYLKFERKPKEYNKITKSKIYDYIISIYEKDPEIILKLCTIEELNILKSLINEEIVSNNGYIEYLIFSHLQSNYLILKDKYYYIPNDILNYIKMAINILDENYYSYKDITDSVLIGISRIYNSLSLTELQELLEIYNIHFEGSIKKYIYSNPKLYNIIGFAKYKKKEYFISLEYNYYKDIINLKSEEIALKKYKLEEVISFGKYKINLFNENLFKYLSFLEMHLDSQCIDFIIKDLMIYMGFNLNNEEVLLKITDNIEELYNETKKILKDFPIWLYSGNLLSDIKKLI